MSEPIWPGLESALVDTGIFILWYRGDPKARLFFRNRRIFYYSKVTRKELLRRPISSSERYRILKLLGTMRVINPEPQVASAYDDLLNRYPYLQNHLADALIAASALAKNLTLVTTNVRHFQPILEIDIVPF